MVTYPAKKEPVSFIRTHTRKDNIFTIKDGESLLDAKSRLKDFHNRELRDILLEEQREDNIRKEEMASTADPIEKKRLEKINGVKAAKAKERINTILKYESHNL